MQDALGEISHLAKFFKMPYQKAINLADKIETRIKEERVAKGEIGEYGLPYEPDAPKTDAPLFDAKTEKPLTPAETAAARRTQTDALKAVSTPESRAKFENAQNQSDHELVKNLDWTPDAAKSKVKEDGVIELDAHDAEFIRRLWEDDKNTRGINTDETPFDGAFLKPENVRKTTKLLDNFTNEFGDHLTPEQIDNVQSLKTTLRDESKKAGDTAIIYSFDHVLPEEKFHREAHLQQAGDSTGEKLLASQIPRETVDALSQSPSFEKYEQGYIGSQYKGEGIHTRVHEYVSKVATGQYSDIGLTTPEEIQQAKADLKDWATGYFEKNPDASIERFERVSEYVKPITDRAREIRTAQQGSQGDEPNTANLRPESGVDRTGKDGTDKPIRGQTATDSRSDETAKSLDSTDTYQPGGKQKTSNTPETLRANNIPVEKRSYQSATNASQIEFANKQLDKGIGNAHEWFDAQLKDGNPSGGTTTVVGINLMQHYGDAGDFANMNKIADSLVPHLTEAGQAIQAMSILSAHDPERAGAYAAKVKKQATGKDLTPEEYTRAKDVATGIQETAKGEAVGKAILEQAKKELSEAQSERDAHREALKTALNDKSKISIKLDDAAKAIRNLKAKLSRIERSPTDKTRPRTQSKLLTELQGKRDGLMASISEKFSVPLKSVSDKTQKSPVEWSDDFPDIVPQTTGARVEAHPDYLAAKKGDAEAAKNVIESVAKLDKIKSLAEQHPNAIVLPIVAEESQGKNKLPHVFGLYIAEHTGLTLDDDIVQTNRTSHTGSSAIHRLFAVPEFAGKVIKGRDYILVDDAATSGSTFKALKEYIESNGGRVVKATTLFNDSNPQTGYSGYLAPKAETLAKLRNKFDENSLNKLVSDYGIAQNIKGLTNSQAKYFNTFNSIESIRNRFIKEGLSRHNRYSPTEMGLEERANDIRPSSRNTSDQIETPESGETVLKSVHAKDKPDADLVDYATLSLLENLPKGKQSVGDFYNEIDAVTGGKLTAEQIRDVHAAAVERIKGAKSFQSPEQKTVAANRREHYKAADDYRNGVIDEFTKKLQKAPDKYTTSLIEAGVKNDFSDEAIFTALARKSLPPEEIAAKLKTEFPDLNNSQIRKAMSDSNDLTARARESVKLKAVDVSNKFKLKNEQIDNIREAQRILNIEKSRARSKANAFYAGLTKSKTRVAVETVVSGRKANLLTGVKRLFQDIISTSANLTGEEGSRLIGSGADLVAALATGERSTQGVSPRAIKNSLKNVVFADETLKKLDKVSGIKAAYDIIRNGYDPNGLESADKAQLTRSHSGDKFGFTGRVADAYINKVFDFVQAGDALTKIVAYRRSLEEIAKVQAINEHRADKSVNINQRRLEILRNPPEVAQLQAVHYAEEATFQNDNAIDKKIVSPVKNAHYAVRAAVDIVMPFTKTPTNVVLRVLDWTPAGMIRAGKALADRANPSVDTIKNFNAEFHRAVATDLETEEFNKLSNADKQAKIQEELGKLFKRQQQQKFAKAFGRSATGTLAGLGTGYLLAANGLLTGSMSPNPVLGDKKEGSEFFNRSKRGIENRSLLIPHVGRFTLPQSPLLISLTLGATLFEQQQMARQQGKDTVGAAMDGLSSAAMDVLAEQPMVKTFADYFGRSQSAGTRFGGIASGFIPGEAMLKDIGDVGDPVQRRASETPESKKQGWTAQEKSGLKNSLFSKVPVARNYFADPATTAVSEKERGGALRRLGRMFDPFGVRSAEPYNNLAGTHITKDAPK